jgi:uncharacterized membrane protein YgcG
VVISLSSSENTARISLTSATPGVAFTVQDSRFVVLGAGVGELDLQVPAGIYEVREQYGGESEAYLVTATPERPVVRSTQRAIPTVAPALEGSTTSHEYQFRAAAEASQRLRDESGPQAGLVLMCRTPRDGIPGPAGPPPMSLHSLAGEPLPELAGQWDVHYDYALTRARLEPGVYLLRTSRPNEEAFEQALVVCRHWQTLLFCPNGWNGPEPERASVHMCQLYESWEYGGRLHLVLEAALAGLAEGRLDISQSDIDMLLYGKFTDPMLGIIGAHALLLGRHPRSNLYDLVIRNLEALIPEHPDVVALGMRVHGVLDPGGRTLDVPPMLGPSYQRLLLPADLQRSSVIPARSPLERAAGSLLERGVWFTWHAGALAGSPDEQATADRQPAQYGEEEAYGGVDRAGAGDGYGAADGGGYPGGAGYDGGGAGDGGGGAGDGGGAEGYPSPAPSYDPVPPPRAASPALRRMQAYVDQVGAVGGWTREEAAGHLTPVEVASACALPIGVVERLMPQV